MKAERARTMDWLILMCIFILGIIIMIVNLDEAHVFIGVTPKEEYCALRRDVMCYLQEGLSRG